MAKGEKVEIRMTTEEKAELYGRADELDMKPTDYVRMLLFAPASATVAVVAETAVKPPAAVPVVSNGKEYTGASYMFNGRLMYEYKENGRVLSTSIPPGSI
jgi:hypothetical protein